MVIGETGDLGAVGAFYESVGYGCALDAGDRLVVAELEGRVVAAVRLCVEEGVLVLRGMYVAAGRRGQGLGKRLLALVDEEIGPAECWCLPYEHLTGFYGHIGFAVQDPGSAPPFLADRLKTYTRQGRSVVIMCRSDRSNN